MYVCPQPPVCVQSWKLEKPACPAFQGPCTHSCLPACCTPPRIYLPHPTLLSEPAFWKLSLPLVSKRSRSSHFPRCSSDSIHPSLTQKLLRAHGKGFLLFSPPLNSSVPTSPVFPRDLITLLTTLCRSVPHRGLQAQLCLRSPAKVHRHVPGLLPTNVLLSWFLVSVGDVPSHPCSDPDNDEAPLTCSPSPIYWHIHSADIHGAPAVLGSQDTAVTMTKVPILRS